MSQKPLLYMKDVHVGSLHVQQKEWLKTGPLKTFFKFSSELLWKLTVISYRRADHLAGCYEFGQCARFTQRIHDEANFLKKKKFI